MTLKNVLARVTPEYCQWRPGVPAAPRLGNTELSIKWELICRFSAVL